MNTSRRFKLIILAAALVIAFGTVGLNELAKRQAAARSSAQDGVVRMALGDFPEGPDPLSSHLVATTYILLNVYDGMYRLSDDGTSLEPGLVDTYDLSNDGLTYTFTLKKDLKWSDGTALTAEDVEYSWKRVLAPGANNSKQWALYVLKNAEAFSKGECSADAVGVKALDARTLEVKLEAVTPYFLSLISGVEWLPVQKAFCEAHKGEDTSEMWTQMPYSGAFCVAQADRKIQTLKLVKNEFYYGADAMEVKEIDATYSYTAEQASDAFRRGEVDVVYGFTMTSDVAVKYEGVGELESHDVIGYIYYDFNCDREYLPAKVRRAMSIAIDREEINQNCFPTKPRSMNGFIPFGILYGTENETYRERAGEKAFEESSAEAKKLLEEAGYTNGEGIPELHLITSDEDSYVMAAQIMKDSWEKLGLKVTVDAYPSDTYWDLYYEGDYDLAFDGWTGSYADPAAMLEIFNAEKVGGESRWHGEKMQRYNELLKQAMTEADNSKRMEISEEMEQILAEEMPVMPLFNRNVVAIHNQHIKNVTISFDSTPVFRSLRMQKER